MQAIQPAFFLNMSSSLKTIIAIAVVLLGAFLLIRRAGVFANQKDRVEQELAKPVPIGTKWTVTPTWNERNWTGDRCNLIAADTTNRLYALVRGGDQRGDDIIKIIVRYQDIRQADLIVDNEPLATASRPRLATKAVEGITPKTPADRVREKMPVIQPVMDEEAIRDIRLVIYTTDGRTVPLSFGLKELRLAKKWYSQIWQTVQGNQAE